GRGRGTFVRETTLTAGARGLTSFTSEMQALGLTAGGRTIESGVVSAAEDVATALDVPTGAAVVMIRLLRTGDGVPIGVQTAYLPAARFPGLEEQRLDDQSLYAVLRDRYGVTPSEAIETFRITHVEEADAALLEVPAGACAFTV